MSSEHPGARTIERHCDVAVVGGSAAGLAAALQLGRQRRSVIVIDAGEPRNAPAAHMHSFLTREGRPPSELTAIGRSEVRAYGCEVLDGRVHQVTRQGPHRFRLDLAGGHAVIARRVLAATGLVDELPEIEGLAEQWGRDVVHCPFCHGYEVRDRRIVQIVTHPANLHPTPLWAQLTDQLTVVLQGDVDIDPTELDPLRGRGVDVVAGRVRRVRADGRGRLVAVELDGREPLPADAVAIGPRFRASVAPFAALGLQPAAHPSGLGDHLETDATGQTQVAGVYAAGNVADPSLQVLAAAADGSRVGAMISFDLAREDATTAGAPSPHAIDWDHRYGAVDQLWSGRPNGALVREAEGLAPGRALDVGAGEGGDAIWLAERGWQVTATDISGLALARLGAEAERRGLAIERRVVDANALDAFEPGFDLVIAMYASIPRTADGRAVQNLLQAVAPGGTLLVVSHDLQPMRAPIDTTSQSRAFDPDAYVRVEDVVDALAEDPAWEIEVHELRPRPSGAASEHHVDDVILRARRTR